MTSPSSEMLPYGVSVQPITLIPCVCARSTICARAPMSASALTLPWRAPPLMSLIDSMIISHLTPDCASTSRSNLASALTPAPSPSTRFPEMPSFTIARLAVAAFAATANLAIVNEGISGNRVLGDGAGVSALTRFDRDVLGQSGVKWLMIMEGINDIGLGAGGRGGAAVTLTADDLTGA